MIRINRKTDYAIRVLLSLVKQGENALLPTSQIQQQMLIPKLLSSRVVAELAQGEFVVTFPGRDSGVKIALQAKSNYGKWWNTSKIISRFPTATAETNLAPLNRSALLAENGRACWQ